MDSTDSIKQGQSRPSLFSSATSSVRCGPSATLRSSFESLAWVETPSGFGAPSEKNSSPLGSGAKHGAPHRARTMKGSHPPTYLHLRSSPPPLAFLHLPEAWPLYHTRLWRAQGSASDLRAARNILLLFALFRRRLGLPPKPSAGPTARELSHSWFADMLSLVDFSC